jgi:predicted oxidoreductase
VCGWKRRSSRLTIRSARCGAFVDRHDYSWFVLTSTMASKEFVLSGSEQNLDFTGKDWRAVLKNRRGGKTPPSVQAFLDKGEDFIVRDNLGDLVEAMNELPGNKLIDHDGCAPRSRRATARSTIPTFQGRAGAGHPQRARAISATRFSA